MNNTTTIAQDWAYQYEVFANGSNMYRGAQTAAEFQTLPFASVCPMSRALGEAPAEIAYTLQDLESSARERRRVSPTDPPADPFPDPVGDVSFGVCGALIALWFAYRRIKTLLHCRLLTQRSKQ